MYLAFSYLWAFVCTTTPSFLTLSSDLLIVFQGQVERLPPLRGANPFILPGKLRNSSLNILYWVVHAQFSSPFWAGDLLPWWRLSLIQSVHPGPST